LTVLGLIGMVRIPDLTENALGHLGPLGAIGGRLDQQLSATAVEPVTRGATTADPQISAIAPVSTINSLKSFVMF
jgi:hypothetical protein